MLFIYKNLIFRHNYFIEINVGVSFNKSFGWNGGRPFLLSRISLNPKSTTAKEFTKTSINRTGLFSAINCSIVSGT